jgi:hypothetical protein
VAVKGTVTILDSGDYAPFTVDKSVTVEAAPGTTAIITPVPNGGTVTFTTTTTDIVRLRGLTIDGNTVGANGIACTQIGQLYVESCVVRNFGGVGVYFSLSTRGDLFMKDTLVQNCGGADFAGVYLNGTATGFDNRARGTIDHCRIEGNAYGLIVDQALGSIRDSVVSGNAVHGLWARAGQTNNARLTVESCEANYNRQIGIYANGSFFFAEVYVSNSNASGNTNAGVQADSNGIFYLTDNRFFVNTYDIYSNGGTI